MTLFFGKFITAKPTTLQNFFYAKKCRNVQTTLAVNLRPGPVWPETQPNFLKSPQMETILSPQPLDTIRSLWLNTQNKQMINET